MQLNNILLGIFLAIGILNIVLKIKTYPWQHFFSSWPILLFFIAAITGAFYDSDFFTGIKLLEKYWALLLIPLVILGDRKTYYDKRNKIFLFLALGCVVTLIICYANLAYGMVNENETLNSFFRWKHTGIQFTQIADTHPVYLGLFTVTSIVFIFQSKITQIGIKYLILIFLSFGLFQIASKMALILFLFFVLHVIFKNVKKDSHIIIILILGLLLSSLVIYKQRSNEKTEQLFSVESFVGDKKLKRWNASYDIFKENPFLGVGFSKIESIRNEKYISYGFELAARNDLNAHNQFLEMLSRNGFIGGFVFVIALGFLLLLSLYKKDHLFIVIFIFFILANMTESIMVRIKGIEFFAIFTALFLCKPNKIIED
jgi:O-antigen ligase